MRRVQADFDKTVSGINVNLEDSVEQFEMKAFLIDLQIQVFIFGWKT